jgi:hypothetical protein
VPSKSKAQHNLMAMVANDPKAAKRMGIPQSVGRDYVEADKGRKFGSGGSMKESKSMMKKEIAFMQKKGAPKSMIKHEKAEYGMKHGGMADKAGRALKKRSADTMGRAMVKKMAGGGMAYSSGGATGSYRRAADGIASKGKTKGKMVRMNMGGKC